MSLTLTEPSINTIAGDKTIVALKPSNAKSFIPDNKDLVAKPLKRSWKSLLPSESNQLLLSPVQEVKSPTSTVSMTKESNSVESTKSASPPKTSLFALPLDTSVKTTKSAITQISSSDPTNTLRPPSKSVETIKIPADGRPAELQLTMVTESTIQSPSFWSNYGTYILIGGVLLIIVIITVIIMQRINEIADQLNGKQPSFELANYYTKANNDTIVSNILNGTTLFTAPIQTNNEYHWSSSKLGVVIYNTPTYAAGDKFLLATIPANNPFGTVYIEGFFGLYNSPNAFEFVYYGGVASGYYTTHSELPSGSGYNPGGDNQGFKFSVYTDSGTTYLFLEINDLNVSEFDFTVSTLTNAYNIMLSLPTTTKSTLGGTKVIDNILTTLNVKWDAGGNLASNSVTTSVSGNINGLPTSKFSFLTSLKSDVQAQLDSLTTRLHAIDSK